MPKIMQLIPHSFSINALFVLLFLKGKKRGGQMDYTCVGFIKIDNANVPDLPGVYIGQRVACKQDNGSGWHSDIR